MPSTNAYLNLTEAVAELRGERRLLRAAIGDAIATIEREGLYEGSLDEEKRILGVLRAALIDGQADG
jgi:hypothetical protein